MGVKSWHSPAIPVLAGDVPPLRVHDSASGKVRPVEVVDDCLRMYVCGITPYDATHLGHAATYLAFDVLQRVIRDAGHQVRYVQNVTDIDDPLLERATRDGVDWRQLAEEQIELFRADMTALRIIAPDAYVGAVESMDGVSEAVSGLLGSGYAYRVDDLPYPDVYFDLAQMPDFGYISHLSEPDMLALFAERGGDPERAGKRHQLDPLLWRMARPGEPCWSSVLGDGRPGWHIECAVIARQHLGGQIQIQGGGTDLAFPHHECSAAHAEALAGAHPFAASYLHTGMLGYDGQKMSKSLGNLVFVSKLLSDGHDPMAIRLALLDGHYRADREWTADALARAHMRLAAYRAAADRQGMSAEAVIYDLRAVLAADLDTPAALAVLDDWAATEVLAGAAVATAADALLGVQLRP